MLSNTVGFFKELFFFLLINKLKIKGLEVKGIYRLSGQHSKTTSLLEKFNKNARETSVADVNVHDVTNALKRWFKTHHRCLMTSKLYSSWVDTAGMRFSVLNFSLF